MSALTSSIVPQASTPKPIYLAETPLLDVLLEQVKYLVEHGDGCAPNCPDCRRLARVKRCLLQPFGEKAPAKAMAAQRGNGVWWR